PELRSVSSALCHGSIISHRVRGKAEKTGHINYLDTVAEELNDRPRKTLGFMKPSEKIIELLDTSN
ncbi:hypothetical protein, partial [Bifidobacterium bifidum]|uniref:hypothetical protein n=1 Tax=Bifidobacterium bifidum TaxID=1681 RepID=UPI002235A147